MNELLIQSLLLDRYNTQFLGLLRKLTLPFSDIFPAHSMKERQGRYIELPAKPCSYPNNIATSRCTTNAKTSSHIKQKIQNAINKAMQGEKEDSGVFIGGRRRNRRRRPNKNKPSTQNKKNKKNNATKKNTKNSENSRKAADHEDSDQTPLITSEWPPADNNKETEDREDSGVWTVDTEVEDNLDSDTMPFFKRKTLPKQPKEETPPPAPAPAEESNPANGGSVPAESIPYSNNSAEPVINKSGDQEQVALNTLAQESKKAETAVEEKATKQDAVDGGSDSLPAKIQVNGDAKQSEENVKMSDNVTNDSSCENVAVSEQPTKKTVIESSPLIEKDSKILWFNSP
ncbi:Hypothetical predicted protein [Octopus vulgaris]|uniref:Uncharacterized protein n=1 Tax=Octopus vulgaris TaxID=6645 RepID=A0AA36FLG1_OCTVU|nr:Hypothetical predicted protein [Octopus vulgaris]